MNTKLSYENIGKKSKWIQLELAEQNPNPQAYKYLATTNKVCCFIFVSVMKTQNNTNLRLSVISCFIIVTQENKYKETSLPK